MEYGIFLNTELLFGRLILLGFLFHKVLVLLMSNLSIQ